MPLFPLSVLRYFEPASEQRSPLAAVRPAGRQPSAAAGKEASSWPEVERRKLDTRRQADRREKQQAILLDTRKTQGRRRTAGRRSDDSQAAPAIHISVQG
ncbi:MAG: hypothetical protein HYZ65_12505 [Burkholderiales bacterium]|nr:hypothetical protein [Burkholderiales bacterium]